MGKPPAFQFYAKDWRSSPNVRRMTLKEEGLYIRLCALAWDSDSPGTITLSEAEICREVRVLASTLRRFLVKFASCWRREGETFVQPKLREQYAELVKFIENRSLAGKAGNAVRWHSDRSALASASATATAKIKTRANDAREPADPLKTEDEQRRAVAARDRRLDKEFEAKRDAAVGSLFSFPSKQAEEGNVKKSYLEFIELRNTNQIPRETTWAEWQALTEDQRRQLMQRPGPASCGAAPAVDKAVES